MKCYLLLLVCVGALVGLAASKPTNKLNINQSTLTIVSSAVVTDSPDYSVGRSDFSRNFVPPHIVSSDHKRERRSVVGDGKNCSTGKIRLGPRCVSCAWLQQQNPHACKNLNDTLDFQTTTQDTLPQQWSSISSPNSDSDIISTSTSFNSDITIKFSSTITSSTIMTTVLDSGSTEASIVQSTLLSSNVSSNISLALNLQYLISFLYLIFIIDL